jgi:hypothetical protein
MAESENMPVQLSEAEKKAIRRWGPIIVSTPD